MIFVTGDLHGMPSSMSRFNTKNFPEQKQMTKDDYVIVVGDFGWVWYGEENNKEEKYWLNWLNNKPWTTLFIDGNHDNFSLLDNLPLDVWNGGKVHKVKDSVIHLMRGQTFNLQNKFFFTFGGAASHDKEYRTEGVNWWAREMPSEQEYFEGLINLKLFDWEIDYVLTHTCTYDALEWLKYRLNINVEVDQMHKYFNEIKYKLKYKKWYFGHFHNDLELPDNQYLLYKKIVRVV